MLKHFAFCYNNKCPVHEEAKYGVSYWPQELESEQFKGIKEINRLWESDKDPTVTFSLETAKKLIMQKYDKVTSNARNQ